MNKMSQQCMEALTKTQIDLMRSERQRSDLLEALFAALPFVEDAEKDPCYKPGAVAGVIKRIRSVIANCEAEL